MVSKLLRVCLLMMLLPGCSMFSDMMPASKPSEPLSVAEAPKTISPEAPRQIALLIPLQGDLANAGKALQLGFNDAYQQSAPKPQIKIYDTSQAGNINALYEQAVNEGANYIVGPLEKHKVAALENNKNIKVITIALNNPDSSIYSPNFYEFSLSPTDEAKQVADKASKDGHSSALLITPSGSWGQNIASAFTQRWTDNNGTIIGQMEVSNSNELNAKLQTLFQAQDYDVIVMIVQPGLARQIMPLLKTYNANNVPVYSTSLIYSGLMNGVKDKDLEGIQFCDMPLVLDGKGPWALVRQQLTVSQPAIIQQYIRLYGLGWDAALLSQHFDQLKNGMGGATGYLTLDEHNDILRKLNFAVFENGIPKVNV